MSTTSDMPMRFQVSLLKYIRRPPATIMWSWLRACLNVGRRDFTTTPLLCLIATEASQVGIERCISPMTPAFTRNSTLHPAISDLSRLIHQSVVSVYSYAGTNGIPRPPGLCRCEVRRCSSILLLSGGTPTILPTRKSDSAKHGSRCSVPMPWRTAYRWSA